MKNKDFCKAKQPRLGRLGVSDTPPLIAQPEDSNSQDHRLNCLAWYMLCNRTPKEIRAWLKKRKPAGKEDMRNRLNHLYAQAKAMRHEKEEAEP